MLKKFHSFFLLSLLLFTNTIVYTPIVYTPIQSEIVKGYQTRYYETKPIIHAPTFTTSIMILEDDDFLNYSLSGNGTLNDPYVIENFDITTSNSTGVHISGTTKHFIVRNGYVDAEQYGIRIADVAENTSKIINVTSSFNYETIDCAGISISSANGIQLIDNVCMNNHYGIHVSNSYYSVIVGNTCSNNIANGMTLTESIGCLVDQNICTYNSDGLATFHSLYTVFRNNIFESNDGEGLNIATSGGHEIENCSLSNNKYGLYLQVSDTITIRNNTIIGNEYVGIHLLQIVVLEITNNTIKENYVGIDALSSVLVSVTYNLFENNTAYGIDMTGYNNSVHHNRFIGNNGGLTQSRDDGTHNLWYDPELKEGNYWDGHQSGKPYEIVGYAESVDKYPLDSNMNRIPRNWNNLIFGVVIGVSLVAVLTWMAYPKIKARRRRAKKILQKRRSAPVPPDYDKIVDEEHQKAREKVALKDY